jgi:hypothetical protein
MTVPLYLLDKIARHGHAAERLRAELREQRDEGDGGNNACHAVAFDAANFVWSFLVLSGHDEAQEDRSIRNAIAEAIIDTLERRGVTGARLNLEGSDL